MSSGRLNFGGIAQLARASGSYPAGRWFKSDYRYHFGSLVKRLRHRPFTAVTGVRFSHGSPKKNTCTSCRCSFLSSRVHSTCKRLPFLRSKMTTSAVKRNFAFRFSETGVRILRVKPSRARSGSLRAKIFAAGEILPLYSLSL